MPQRIQRRRTKGWRMPEDAVYVGRGSRWGNWYVIKTAYAWHNGHYELGNSDADLIIKAVDKHGFPSGNHWAGFADKRDAAAFAVELYRRALDATYADIDGPLNRDFYLRGLKGQDLACWCALDQPCHADVLLEIANAA